MEEDKRKLWSPSEKRGGRKRIGIAVALIILLAVVASTSIYNMPSNRLARQLNVADKFLAEKNYEQAIVEYMKAIEIDPKAEEALRGLEDTYLAYAQNIAEMGDIEKAVSILKEGHAQIGRESLRLKIEEIEKSQIIEFPFDFKDITIKGYDLLESRFEELCKAFQVEEVREDYYVPKDYGDIKVAALARSENYSENRLLVSSNLLNSSATIEYQEWDEEIGLGMSVNSDDRESGINWCKYISTPIVPGDSYEDWCRIMQVDSIKEKGEKEE